MASHFKRGSGVYKCQDCGKRTRETCEGESSCDLCLDCFDDASNENEHNDTHDEKVAGCKYCA